MLFGEIRLWTLAPGVRLFWGGVLGHVAQKHQSHFPRSYSFDDFDQRPPRGALICFSKVKTKLRVIGSFQNQEEVF